MCPRSSTSLTFFVELASPSLVELFAQQRVMDSLVGSSCAISMAMLDLSAQRAAVIRTLNACQVPVTAWLVLEEQQGYWLNADNVDLACARYQQLHQWACSQQLRIDRIGLDIEPPHRDALALAHHGRRALVRMLHRRRGVDELSRAVAGYTRLVDQIRADGHGVETYQVPLILDERLAGSSLLQRVAGIVDLISDREVVMLYRSLLPRLLGHALVDSYGPHCDAIGVGITGGGVGFVRQMPGFKPMELDELLADLRRARRYTDQLYVFSLEGCVQAGYLHQLCQADLSRPLPRAPLAAAGRLTRAGLRLLLRSEGLLTRRRPGAT